MPPRAALWHTTVARSCSSTRFIGFSKSQQDALLHAVENRTVVLVGATTENPYFEVNSALLSRSRVVELEHLSNDDIAVLVRRALTRPEGLGGRVAASDEVVAQICTLAAGDARAALTTLELASEIALTREPTDGMAAADGAATGAAASQDANAGTAPVELTMGDVRMANPRRGLSYDKSGDMHYDIISAFIKSMRGSDPDAAVYWLARMIDAGEDPKFIARRILIAASEDVGNADPQAILVAHAAFKAAEVIGYPECRINLAQAAIYLALAPKSNACEAAIDAALADVRASGMREVPSHLRDRHRPGSINTVRISIRTTIPRVGWNSSIFLRVLSAGAFWHPAGRGWEEWRYEMGARRSQPGTNTSQPES